MQEDKQGKAELAQYQDEVQRSLLNESVEGDPLQKCPGARSCKEGVALIPAKLASFSHAVGAAVQL